MANFGQRVTTTWGGEAGAGSREAAAQVTEGGPDATPVDESIGLVSEANLN